MYLFSFIVSEEFSFVHPNPEFIEQLFTFKVQHTDTGEQIWSKYEKIVTEVEKLKLKDNFHYFLSRVLIKKTYEEKKVTETEKRTIQDAIENKPDSEVHEKLKSVFKKIHLLFPDNTGNTGKKMSNKPN